MKPDHVVEAALFSAGRALSIEEIAEETGMAKPAIRQAIDRLAKVYQGRDTVLEVAKAGTKWAMQVRTQAADDAAKFAQMEIPAKVLKTLALIAYHQPIKQSELSDMIGSRVYDHVPELKERGLVKTRREGQTKILTVTQAFPEYFGLDAKNPEEIRKAMGKLVGIEADPKKEVQRTLAAPPSNPEEAAKSPNDAAASELPEGLPRSDPDAIDVEAQEAPNTVAASS